MALSAGYSQDGGVRVISVPSMVCDPGQVIVLPQLFQQQKTGTLQLSRRCSSTCEVLRLPLKPSGIFRRIVDSFYHCILTSCISMAPVQHLSAIYSLSGMYYLGNTWVLPPRWTAYLPREIYSIFSLEGEKMLKF